MLARCFCRCEAQGCDETKTYTCYCMCMYERRLQILLDEERFARVSTLAQQRGTSVAAVIREAIDRGLPVGQPRRRAAGNRILAAAPMPVPDDPADLIAELDDLRSGGR